MSWIESLILGIIQGLTEFLPVSSSGHLELGKAIMGDTSLPEESLMFTVVVHAATALSTVVVYRKDIVKIFAGIFKFNWNEDSRFALNIIISMIPAGFVGLFFEDQIEALFGGQVVLVGAMLVITGLLLLLADRAKKTHKKVGHLEALIIGVSQAIAILPGISRSGATISTSVLLGIDRERAARFSFLMVVPLILGKIILDIKDVAEIGIDANSDKMMPLFIGFVAAFVSGLFACRWMIALVRRAKLVWFATYCFAVGVIALLVNML